jgi:hypothetical protein
MVGRGFTRRFDNGRLFIKESYSSKKAFHQGRLFIREGKGCFDFLYFRKYDKIIAKLL